MTDNSQKKLGHDFDSGKDKVPPLGVAMIDSFVLGIILEWFYREGVRYPWSGGVGAYAVWVSEVMLQQTTVKTVIPRYKRWMEIFPTVADLASTEEEIVLREWEGLGYYSRARNLLAAAREIVARHGASVPTDLSLLRALPGVGEYSAAAIVSFAYGQRRAAIDANGRRITQRITAEKRWSKALENSLRNAIEMRMPTENPGDLNAAVMQLGQGVCLPRKPRCQICPLSSFCLAQQEGKQEQIPWRRPPKIIKKSTYLLILVTEHKVFVQKRITGIGKGLWVFPEKKEKFFFHLKASSWGFLPQHLHSYTCYRDRLIPEIFYVDQLLEEGKKSLVSEGQWVTLAQLESMAMPTAYRRVSKDLKEFFGNKTKCFSKSACLESQIRGE